MIGYLYVLKSGYSKDIYVVVDIGFSHIQHFTLLNTVTQNTETFDVHEFTKYFQLFT